MKFLGYYLKWVPQENHYLAAEKARLEANPDGRSEGTYSAYASWTIGSIVSHYLAFTAR